MAAFRYVPNPRVFAELARSSGMREILSDRAEAGAGIARTIAPEYSGPTYDPGVQRRGEYKASVYSAVSMRPNGWRAEFGATAPWTLQVEFGTGRPATSRHRPQAGWSPKTRTLGRALESLRS